MRLILYARLKKDPEIWGKIVRIEKGSPNLYTMETELGSTITAPINEYTLYGLSCGIYTFKSILNRRLQNKFSTA